jgi:EAL domain-containing protein (putative c-di-GMP-specific phosphodiesterase class I)
MTAPVASTPVEKIGMQLRDLFPGLRLQFISLHDAKGDALWLSEGAIGPDEHSLVLDAMDLFALETRHKCFEKTLGDGRTALIFAARDPRGERRGAAMLMAESRSLDGSAQEKALLPALQSLLKRFSVLLAPASAETSGTQTMSASMSMAGFSAGDTLPGAPATQAAPEPTLLMPASAVSGLAATAGHGEFAELVLYVQQLLKLRTSGRTRRYEVLLRSRSGGEVGNTAPEELLRKADEHGSGGLVDRYVVSQLTTWLERNRDSLDSDPVSFSVNLSTGALADASFPEFIHSTLKAAGLPPRLLAFEIREIVCREKRADVERFIGACERMGCQVVIDDFTLHSDVLPLLRSKAVRLVKIDAALTAAAMQEKLAQALVVAISQSAKVLGTHCVAKRIDSSMARQWLAAIGVDFAQGFLLEGPLPLTNLASLTDANSATAN